MLGKIIPIMVASCSMAVNPIQKNVIYYDEYSQITLNSNELNDYTFENLANLLHDSYVQNNEIGISTFFATISYGDQGYEEDDGSADDGYFSFINEFTGEKIDFNPSFYDYKFYYYPVYESESTPFTLNLTFNCESDTYSAIKTAIEQDISSNETTNMPSASDLFEVIGEGVSEFAEVMGEVFQNITQLFWTTGTNPGPTFLGLLTLLAVGAGLIYLGYRIIAGLVRRLRG